MLSRSALNKINRGDFGVQFWPCLVHLHNLAYINSNEEFNKTLEKASGRRYLNSQSTYK